MDKLLIFLFAAFFSLSAWASRLPDLGDPSQHILNSKQMQELNRNFMNDLERHTDVIADPVISHYINQLGNRLVLYSGAKKRDFHFLLIADPEINAFAGPAGIIGVNSGLFIATRNESELAAVIAHEISHVSQRHLLRTIAKAKRMQIPMLLASLAAIAIGTQSGDLGSGALLAGMAGFQQDMINFTRSHEKEADRIGIDMLYRAHYNPNSMASFFQRMHQQERLHFTSNLPAILRSHPVTASRIADANNRSASMSRTAYPSQQQYQLIKARIRVLTAQRPGNVMRYFAQQVKKTPQAAKKYGYALSLLTMRKPQAAQKWIEQLVSSDKEEWLYHLLQADYYTDIKQYSQALATLKQALYIYPENAPLIIQYAKTLILAKQAANAEQFLQEVVYQHDDNIGYLLLLARAQAANKHQAAAYLSSAQAMLMAEQPQLAYTQLRIAKRLARKDGYLQAKIDALLHELKPKHK